MANPMMTFVCGALVGAAVGTAVALLYAPTSGQDTRNRISERAGDMKDSAVDWKHRTMDAANEWKDRTVDAATEWKDMALTSASDTLDKAAESMKSAGDGVDPRHKIGSKS